MTFVFAGVEIDIGFAAVQRDYLPETISRVTDDYLDGADEYTMRALNGSRVADAICDVVTKSGSNLEEFRSALRTLKLWAARRGVYSNKMGYVAGVQLAILVAKICQSYPTAVASTIGATNSSHFLALQWPFQSSRRQRSHERAAIQKSLLPAVSLANSSEC